MKHVHTFESFNSSVNEGEFWRLPKNAAIGNDFYIAQKNLQLIYDAVKNGQNFDMDMFDKTLQILEKIKKQAKKFKNAEAYESFLNESMSASSLNEANQTTDNTPFDEKEIEKGLEDRSKTSGIPVEILRVVMRRGMEKHSKSRSTPNRWNATAQEWGFARVDSFINKDKPTWGDADADLRPEV